LRVVLTSAARLELAAALTTWTAEFELERICRAAAALLPELESHQPGTCRQLASERHTAAASLRSALSRFMRLDQVDPPIGTKPPTCQRCSLPMGESPLMLNITDGTRCAVLCLCEVCGVGLAAIAERAGCAFITGGDTLGPCSCCHEPHKSHPVLFYMNERNRSTLELALCRPCGEFLERSLGKLGLGWRWADVAQLDRTEAQA
jgi:hypothetical protein